MTQCTGKEIVINNLGMFIRVANVSRGRHGYEMVNPIDGAAEMNTPPDENLTIVKGYLIETPAAFKDRVLVIVKSKANPHHQRYLLCAPTAREIPSECRNDWPLMPNNCDIDISEECCINGKLVANYYFL